MNGLSQSISPPPAGTKSIALEMGACQTAPCMFITGATGYIGSVVTKLAIAKGYQVRGLSRSFEGDQKLKSLGAIPIRGDLLALEILHTESAKADAVIHLADSFLDHTNPKAYDEVTEIDRAAVDALAEGLKGTENPLLVTSGTLVVAPDPCGAETYEDSPIDPAPFVNRIASERHALSWAEKGVRVAAVRLAPYVYGHGGSGISTLMKIAATDGQIGYINDGDYHTSTVHVDDAARLFLLAAERARPGQVFNATSSTDVTSRQITEAIGAALSVPAVSLTEGEAAEALGPFMSKFLSAQNRASNAKAVQELGWEPRENGLLDEIAQGSYLLAAQDLRIHSI